MLIPEWLDPARHLPHRLHLERHGGHGRPLIVCLHGIATNGEIWRPLIDELGSEYQIVTLDLLGHGRSPKPTHVTYSTDEHVRAIRWTLFTHGLWRPAIFVGFSIGALISSRLAARYPHITQGLVLAAPPIYRRPDELNSSAVPPTLDRAYLRIYRALRSVPRDVAVRSASMVKRHVPAVLGVNRLDEHTWYPLVSTLRSTIELQTAVQDVARWPRHCHAIVLYGSLDHLVVGKNVRDTFTSRSNVRLKRLTAPHELTKAYVRAIAAGVRELAPQSAILEA